VQAFARVAIDSPVGALDREFDYAIPERMLGRVQVGSVVRVVLHGRNVRAFVTALLDEPAVPKVRQLSSLVSEEPIFTEETLALARWTARRYVTPLGMVLHDNVPGRFSTPEAPPASQAPRVVKPSWFTGTVRRGETCVVTPTPTAEVELIAHLAGEAAVAGRRTLVVCPRVDVAERIANAIPGSAVMQSEERPADRAAAWAAARDGRVDVVVGGRSALFAPVRDLGLVVVASAHDRSLKSERAPRVHALVVARQRARLAGAAFVATSPAPPLELAGTDVRWIHGKRGPVRPETARPRKGPVTQRLLEVVRSTVDAGQDVFVFAGRKGGTLRLRCVDCGWTVPMDASGPDSCESCGGRLSERGWGHERIAREIEKAGFAAPVVRIVAGEVPERPGDTPVVLVGTIAAAYAWGEVGAVCVADFDQLLGRTDFRAAEYALQTLHELAGLVTDGGRFVVQTREPEHHVVQAFMRGSYRYFLDRELPMREETTYPPFGAVVRVELDESLVRDLDRAVEPAGGRVLGSIVRRGKSNTLVRAPRLAPLLDPLRAFSLEHPRVKVDVDPTELA
jgi:primosomal protein N' (replication factor Y) (superfamily II helicase)